MNCYELMVNETNLNAALMISSLWQPDDEKKKFIGVLMYMGLSPLSRISDYWSTKLLYKNYVASKVISRDRFQILLRFWHFNDNNNLARDGRLGRISPLIVILNNIFKNKKSPGQGIVVDESMIPFRGRLLLRQYLPNKSHK